MSERALLLTNANVITMWSERPRASEAAIENGRFVWVGDGVKPPKDAAVIDLGGRTVLPGFIDSHVHLVPLGLAPRSADLSEAESLAGALERVAARAAAMAPGEVLRAPGWDESAWPERRPPTRADLDRAAPRLVVVAPRVCGHVRVVNTRALEAVRAAAGLDDDALTAAGADLDTGTLVREAGQYARAVALPDRRERLDALADACRLALTRGVTTVQDMSHEADLYVALRRAGRLPLRACVADHPTEEGGVPEPLAGEAGDERLWPGPLKVFADGSFGAHTAALHGPYIDRPTSSGDLYTPPDELARLVAAGHGAGRQVACHAIGDRGIAAALAAFETVLHAGPRRDHRHRIEHCELVSPETLGRMRGLGLIASVQPNFAGRWGRPGGLYERRLGRRARLTNPFASMARAGVAMAFGSDGMPMDPLYGIWSAVTHPVAGERIAVEEAIRHSTVGGAFAAFAEGSLGRIAPGFHADAVVLGADPAGVDPEAIKDIPVEAVLVAGGWVYGDW